DPSVARFHHGGIGVDAIAADGAQRALIPVFSPVFNRGGLTYPADGPEVIARCDAVSLFELGRVYLIEPYRCCFLLSGATYAHAVAIVHGCNRAGLGDRNGGI